MSAMAGAAGGAAAGVIRRQSWERKIMELFPAENDQRHAFLVLDLLLNSQGSIIIAVVFMSFPVPSMMAGIGLGEKIGGNIGAIIGMFLAPISIFIVGMIIDYHFFVRPVILQLKQLAEEVPNGRLIEEEVRKIISR